MRTLLLLTALQGVAIYLNVKYLHPLRDEIEGALPEKLICPNHRDNVESMKEFVYKVTIYGSFNCLLVCLNFNYASTLAREYVNRAGSKIAISSLSFLLSLVLVLVWLMNAVVSVTLDCQMAEDATTASDLAINCA